MNAESYITYPWKQSAYDTWHNYQDLKDWLWKALTKAQWDKPIKYVLSMKIELRIVPEGLVKYLFQSGKKMNKAKGQQGGSHIPI